MDLRQLTSLVTVAEVGSVTKAARVLHLVQPAVTRQIRTLEEELGVSLFERTRTGMVPTAEGELLLERARRALRELDRARAELRPDPGEVTGSVTVGLLESTIDVLARPLVAAVAERFPAIELRLVTAYSGHLQQWLDAGDVDISLLYNLTGSPSLAVVPLLREQLWAVAPPDAGLTPDSPVPWRSVCAHPLVLPVTGHGLRALIDQARSSLPVGPRPAPQTNSMHLQKKLVLAGHGWTILPAAGVAGDVAAGLLSGAPVTEPDVVRSVVLGLRRGARTPAPVAAVAAELERLVRSLVRSAAWPSSLPS
ncbi:LysR family transcriptional regulator [Pseudonocardia acaciae]|uniref:LysR family transcriptional regulator n=1 Tax=Pseudonocardia acaciae TaxID=551276 RepID=UPI00048B0348|nr:LysR family transcriptional regulator [Pseudonocardia acaciae]